MPKRGVIVPRASLGHMTNTQRISKAAKLTIAGAGVVAVLGAGAAAASASTPLSATTTTSATSVSTSAVNATTAAITYRQAVSIAKKRVPDARVTDVEREWEHGYRVWKVELKKRYAEYRVYISVKTGKIVKFRQKHDD